MVSSLHLLRRLQRHGVPGRAPPVAVPVDRTAAVRAELAGVFAAIEPVVQECRLQVDLAAAEADGTMEQARIYAQRTVEDARARASAVAAEEAAGQLARLERQAEARLASAGAEAGRVEADAAGRGQHLTARIISYTLSLPGPDAGAG